MNDLIESLKRIVGDKGWISSDAELEGNLTEWRGVVRGRTPIMLMPATTKQVSEILVACNQAGVGVVPQGGNTGMCAGAVPDDSGTQVLLTLSRLNRILEVDADNFSLIAEAGCILADLQQAARAAGRYFPLSLGGEGSCQIGGNLSTNAGGINVLRYGTARGLVLGVEVVLADGTVWDGVRTLRKDTAGYDLKQLFIGSEGTLGIITKVALKLLPDPGATTTAMLAVRSASDAVSLLGDLRTSLADQVQAFELIGARAFEFVLRHIPDTRSPFAEERDWYVLLEAAGVGLEPALMSALDSGLVIDAVIAKSQAEVDELWRLRHSISEAEKREGPGVRHDISVPIGKLAAFLEEGETRLARELPELTPVVFGHVGDGNLHYNAHLPKGLDADADKALRASTTELVYGLVSELDGSISAEHGIGLLKKEYLARYKDPVELELMRMLKKTLDPANTLNPGKVI